MYIFIQIFLNAPQNWGIGSCTAKEMQNYYLPFYHQLQVCLASLQLRETPQLYLIIILSLFYFFF